MAGKILNINIALPVRENYIGLADIIGLANSWTAETGKTPTEYAQDPIIKDELVRQLKIIIQSSLERYYGLSQNALISQALLDYDSSIVCDVIFNDDTGE